MFEDEDEDGYIEGVIRNVDPPCAEGYAELSLNDVTLYAGGESRHHGSNWPLPVDAEIYVDLKSLLTVDTRIRGKLRASQYKGYSWELDYLMTIWDFRGEPDYQLIAEILRSSRLLEGGLVRGNDTRL